MQNFEELKLSPEVSKAIAELGYQTPTPIQAQTLPLLLSAPTDFMGLAATGTGKTAAFGIPLVERMNSSRREVQALILCPTRELAVQVCEQLNLFGKHKRVRAAAIYGGAGYGDQIRALRQGAQIVVATPGRLIDHLERGTIRLDHVETVVLDEADEMISMGFKDELETILQRLENELHNTWLFSATMSPEVRRVADRFLFEPQQVQVNKKEMLSGTVRQIYYSTKEADKPEILCKLIDAADEFYGLIFCQTKSLVVDLANLLTKRGYRVDCLHGDKDQSARERTMKAFRERRVSILVCTDVASRGLDVKDLTHVINYSIPRELDNYVHRIGRTGRSGKAGLALSLVTKSHFSLIGRLEKLTGSKIEQGAIPSRKEIGAKKITAFLDKFRNIENSARAEELLGDDWKNALAEMSPNEVAARMLILSFPEIFSERPKASPRDSSNDKLAVVAAANRSPAPVTPLAAPVVPLVAPVAPSAVPQIAMAQPVRPLVAPLASPRDSGKPRNPWGRKPKRFDERRDPHRRDARRDERRPEKREARRDDRRDDRGGKFKSKSSGGYGKIKRSRREQFNAF